MKKGKQPELRTVEENSEESVVRLSVDGEEANPEVVEVEKLTHKVEDDIDLLLKEEPSDRSVDEQELDKLFSEKKPSRHDDEDVRRALVQTKTSKASLLRMKSGEATKVTLAEQMANNVTLEDTWDGEDREAIKVNPAVKVTIICVAVLLVSIGGFAVWKISQSDENVMSDELVKRKELRELHERKTSAALKSVNAAEGVLRSYLLADSVEARLPYVHRGQELRDRMIAYGVKHPPAVYSNLAPLYIKPADGHGENVWSVLFGYGQFNEVEEIYLRKDELGEFEVDWTSQVGAELDDVVAFSDNQDSESKVFRFKIEQKYMTGFYNWGFNDKEYASVRLTVPGVDRTFWGYVPLRNHSLLFKMNHYFEQLEKFQAKYQTPRNKIILKVRFLPDTDPDNKNCFIIEDIVSPSWFFEDEVNYKVSK